MTSLALGRADEEPALGGAPAYAREWRIVARAAGIPDHIKNMDARAGAMTEADDAGASLDDIRLKAGHSNASTTVRYVRGLSGKSNNVAELGLLHRARKTGRERKLGNVMGNVGRRYHRRAASR